MDGNSAITAMVLAEAAARPTWTAVTGCGGMPKSGPPTSA